MSRLSLLFLLVSISIISVIYGCNTAPQTDLVAYTNATIWSGADDQIHENAALITQNGRVVEILSMDAPDFPATSQTIDLDGAYLIPGLINAHGHISVVRGLDPGPAAETIDNVVDQLTLNARYGVTTVVSLGDEPIHAFLVRDNMNPVDRPMSRSFLAGRVLNPPSVDAVEEDVARHIQNRPDWIKIRVDDGLGTRQKLSEEIYSKIISESHSHDKPVAVHIVTLEDAKQVLKNGADLIAHSVRDINVDDELIQLMLQENVCITPTLTRELSTYIYADRPDFFDDPFFLKEADTLVLEQLQMPAVQEISKTESAQFFREALPLAIENMITMHNAGVKIALGTDSGPPARFQGYFEHVEMGMMQDAGMSPLEVLSSATRLAAECMRIDSELGTLESGKWADFIVLDEDPFQDVQNLRSIRSVYIGGNEVKR